MGQSDFQARLQRINAAEHAEFQEAAAPPPRPKPMRQQASGDGGRMGQFIWGIVIGALIIFALGWGFWQITAGFTILEENALSARLSEVSGMVMPVMGAAAFANLWLGFAFWVALIRILMGYRTYMPLILGTWAGGAVGGFIIGAFLAAAGPAIFDTVGPELQASQID